MSAFRQHRVPHCIIYPWSRLESARTRYPCQAARLILDTSGRSAAQPEAGREPEIYRKINCQSSTQKLTADFGLPNLEFGTEGSNFAGRDLPNVAELREQTEYLARVEIAQPEKRGVLLFSRGKNIALGKALA